MAIVDPRGALFERRSFLVVEDFEPMRAILRELLRRCGAKRIETAANTRAAMTLLRRSSCDVVLCDYYLGEGETGQQLLERARQEELVDASTIWIMVTAEKTSGMVTSMAEQQPDDYLVKPVTEASLQARLEKLIARKAALTELTAAMRAKEYLRALDLSKVGLAQDSGNALEILRIQSELYQTMGQPEQARAVFQSVLGKMDMPWARVGLAKLDFREGKLLRARDSLQQLIVDRPKYLEAYDWLARVYQRMGAWQDAERVLHQAVDHSPHSHQRQNALGDTALRCDHLDIAEQAYNKALKLTAQSALKTAAPYLGLARVHTARNKTDEALKILGRMAVDLQSEEAELQAKAEEVRVYHAAGDAERAALVAREVSERIRTGAQELSPAATLEIAQTFMLVGDLGVASELLQFVVRNNHEDDELAASVQEIFDHGGMGEEGRALVAKSRNEAVEAMNQAVRLAAQGQFENALESMQQAKALMPYNPRLLLNHAHVVICLLQKNGWRHDLETEARRSIETARKILPGEKRCGELMMRLESLS
jgi:CheY-like chemotaxis protein/Tfp pilus assembly protein PilF